MKTSLLHTKGPANQKVWHLSQYSFWKGKSHRCSGVIKVPFFIASVFVCVTGYQQEMCMMLVSESYSGTARQTDKETVSVLPFSQWDRPKQFSVLPRPDEISAAKRQRSPSHFLSHTDCVIRLIPCQCPQSDHFHHSCPSTILPAAHRLVFTPHVLIKLPTIDSLLCQTSPPQPSQPVSEPKGAATCQREIIFILTSIRKLPLRKLHTNNFWSKNTSLLRNLGSQSKDRKRNF